MEYSNTKNLPEPLCAAIRRDTYDKGDSKISCTGLLRPPRIAALTDTFDDMIVRDYSKEVWSLFGRAVHHIIENAHAEGYTMEERFFTEIGGWRISGRIDARQEMNDGSSVIIDWKTRKSFGVMNNAEHDEQQTNIYAFLLRRNGIRVSGLQIINLIKDWSAREAERRDGYPDSEVFVQDIPLWSEEKAEEFVRERVLLHQRAREGELPECTPSERWLRDEKFAVNKEGRKSAVRLFDTEGEASTFIEALKDPEKHSIQHRPGTNVRCESFCDVADFCLQFQSIKGNAT